MMRELLLLVAVVPVVHADPEAVVPSCVHPASVEPRAPRKFGGDRIVFTPGTDWRTDVEALHQQYGLLVFFPAKTWNVSVDGVFVPPLTAAQIAQLRCDPVVDRIVLGPIEPEAFFQRIPQPSIHLGLTYSWAPAGEPVSNGLLVESVEGGSIAERAGLRPGDRIVRFDEHEMVYGSDLQRVLANKNPGDVVTMVVTRNGVEGPLVVQF